MGKYGEYLIYKKLRNYEKDNAKFLFNIYIPKPNGETTEIDVLMITPKGIFVFESKNYSGWIFGGEKQKYWYQTLPTGKGKSHKESFYNPVIQNAGHIKHLKSLIGEDIAMYSVITFSDRCTLKNINMTSDEIHVVNRKDIVNIVSNIYNKCSDIMSKDNMETVYIKLFPYSQVTDLEKETHIKNIQNNLNTDIVKNDCSDNSTTSNIIEKDADSVQIITDTAEGKNVNVADDNSVIEKTETEKADKEYKCPICGADLVLRIAKQGKNKGNQFYGCSNFPKCRYVENIKKD